MDEPHPRISGARITRSQAESERADREYWAKLTPDERVLETWRLSLELWEVSGRNPGEPGIYRTVARVVRG